MLRVVQLVPRRLLLFLDPLENPEEEADNRVSPVVSGGGIKYCGTWNKTKESKYVYTYVSMSRVIIKLASVSSLLFDFLLPLLLSPFFSAQSSQTFLGLVCMAFSH